MALEGGGGADSRGTATKVVGVRSFRSIREGAAICSQAARCDCLLKARNEPSARPLRKLEAAPQEAVPNGRIRLGGKCVTQKDDDADNTGNDGPFGHGH